MATHTAPWSTLGPLEVSFPHISQLRPSLGTSVKDGRSLTSGLLSTDLLSLYPETLCYHRRCLLLLSNTPPPPLQALSLTIIPHVPQLHIPSFLSAESTWYLFYNVSWRPAMTKWTLSISTIRICQLHVPSPILKITLILSDEYNRI